MKFKMSFLAFSAIALTSVRLAAQSVFPPNVIDRAHAHVPTAVLRAVRAQRDSLTIVFDDSTLSTQASLTRLLGANPTAADSTKRSARGIGLHVARVLWDGWGREHGTKIVVVEVHGTEGLGMFSNVRWYYFPEHLGVR